MTKYTNEINKDVCLSSISILRCNNVFSHVSIIVGSAALRVQPSKLKFFLGCHLATNSFGLGRLFYKSSHQLQHYRFHGDQNGCNLEGWCVSNQFTICSHLLSSMNESNTELHTGRCAKKIIFTACHSGKLKLAFTSPDVISTSPQNFLTSRIDFTVLLLFKFLKKTSLGHWAS